MLKLICGGAGSGKSTELYKAISASAQSRRNVVLFVPDQFSFEAEKLMYRTVPHEFSRYCRVTMFSREAQRILRDYGETKEYADDIAKRTVMKAVLSRVRPSLLHYGRLAEKREFVGFALNTVSELRAAGMSPADLKNTLSAEMLLSEALATKMNDILTIYEAYDAELKTVFDDRLDDIRRAAELVRNREDIYGGCDVFFDEFDYFSGNQMLFAEAVIEKADSAVFALTYIYPDDPYAPEDPKFTAARRLIGRLSEVDKPSAENIIKLDGTHREPGAPRLIEARDIWQECDWICAEIRSLMEQGVRCRDIAVAAPSADYAPILVSAMQKYGIPAFADIPESLITKSAVKFAVYTLRALTFETDDLLRYIKSGFVRCAVTEDDGAVHTRAVTNIQINKLERVCRKYELRECDWHRPFPEGLEDHDELEELRHMVITPLEKLKKSIADTDGAGMTRELCAFLTDTMQIDKTVRGKCYDDRGNFDEEKFDSYDSVWEEALTVFESAYKALGRHKLSLEEYTEILTDAFASVTLSRPPQFLDSVTVGDTGRSRYGDKDYLFLCGCNNGVMPPPARIPQAFSVSESEMLTGIGIPLAEDRVSRYSAELFTVYRCMNIPRRRLYMTYPLQGSGGELLDAAPMIGAAAKLYKIPIEGADSFGAPHYCRTVRSAEQYLSRIYRDHAHYADKLALKRLPELPEDFRRMLSSAAGENKHRDRQYIQPYNAAPLLTMHTYSPTAIEQLMRCKFAFFCKYGLGLREDSTRETGAALTGNVVHYCLEKLLKRDDFTSMTEAAIVSETQRSVADYERETFFEDFGGSRRFSYILKGLSKYAVQAALRTQEEMAAGGFRPLEFEKELSVKLGSMTVKGRCDRIDGMNSEGKAYIRVVDYKHSRNLKFDLNAVYNGGNLQMLLYLFGICADPGLLSAESKRYFTNGGSSLEPSSVVYFKFAALPYAEAEDNAKDREAKALKSRRDYYTQNSSQGLVIQGSPEEAAMEERIKELTSELYQKRKKEEAPPSSERRFFSGFINSVEITPQEFDAMRGYCVSLLNTRLAEASRGMASACPSSGEASCQYCPYALFCGRR